MTTPDAASSAAVLDFWFGAFDADGLMDAGRRQALFRADPAFDARIDEHFGAAVEAALRGELDHWNTTARGRAAAILLLDQFTRNIYRGHARAFAGDERALTMARTGVECADDRLLTVDERAFFYLPFEHSENIADQDTCVALLERLLSEQGPGNPSAAVVGSYLGHAQEHRAIIRQFGRFPHRNAVLGREDTEAEAAWRQRDRRRFGQ
ncbi:MAG: DUF924 domain-containing protein [Gammaproteobacteria bacterium]|nr:MAG: DUF924 domain-containing protein [Gammaproteobacteria bacterium]